MTNSFYADLHVHSKHSMSTSKHSDLEHLARSARRKGITVVGTGDFTHPGWRKELREKLEPAEPGLFRLRDEPGIDRPHLPGTVADREVRFMLQVEISTIYKKDGETRKVHHLVYVPDFEKADHLASELNRIGNLSSDGRPILGLDSRNLLEITLEAGEGCYLVPAHIWTPWFSLFGSKSGFDTLEACYGDLSEHIFALETGLSSDPPMNWKWSELDDYTLVSNSDAHSPPKLGREACVFQTELDYFAMKRALETGDQYGGTVEFYPEEGKYHLDGHRKCEVRLDPDETRLLKGECPVCEKPLTVGVLHRVYDLSDRNLEEPPPSASPFQSFIPLVEVLSEIEGVGPRTKTVGRLYDRLISGVGPELYILSRAPLEDIERAGRPMIREGIRRMREDDVIREPGFDGEYGTIKLFNESELEQGSDAGLLFELPESTPEEDSPDSPAPPPPGGNQAASPSKPQPSPPPAEEPGREEKDRLLRDLDDDQRRAASKVRGPLLIVAGPGTGKTRTLTYRIANLVANHEVEPQRCLAITFTRRAARELQERIDELIQPSGHRVPAWTFHGFGFQLLREFGQRLQLPEEWRVAGETERVRLLTEELDVTAAQARRWLGQPSEPEVSPGNNNPFNGLNQDYRRALRERGWLDFDDLIELPNTLLSEHPDLTRTLRERYTFVSVDEFQDVNQAQYRLIKHLAPPGSHLCVIGDPDQAIYGFRGSDVRYFQDFEKDYPEVQTVQLSTNYRSRETIVDAALHAVSPDSLLEDRQLRAVVSNGDPVSVKTCPTPRAEAEYVVHSVERLIGGTSFLSFDTGRVETEEGESLSFSDVGVLYRAGAQSKPLEEAFSRSGIPYETRSHDSLEEHPTVQFLVERMRQRPGEEPLPERLDGAVEEWEAEQDGSNPETVHRLVGVLRPLAEQFGDDWNAFRSRIALGVEVDLLDPRADRVSLLTLHASKGLEFRVVFIVGCENGLLPLDWGGATGANPAEERRLFFVGMTRAKDRLYLSRVQRRTLWGTRRQPDPSPFLEDIPGDLLKRVGPSTHRPDPPETDQMDLL